MAVLVSEITTGEVAEMWGHNPTVVGFDPDTIHIMDNGAPGNELMRALLRMPLLPINGVFTDGTLSLNQLSIARPAERPLEMQIVSTDWHAASTGWIEYKPGTSWDTAGGDVIGAAIEFTPPGNLVSPTVLDIDVGPLVLAAQSLGMRELSVRIKHKVEDGSDDQVAFTHFNSAPASLKPLLSLTYTVPRQSIVDVIAEGVVALLSAIRTSGGYPIDVAGVYRHRRIERRTEIKDDLSVSLFQGNLEKPEDEQGSESGAGDQVTWTQRFIATCCRRPADSSVSAKDTLRNEFAASVQKALYAENGGVNPLSPLVYVSPGVVHDLVIEGSSPNDPDDGEAILEEIEFTVTYKHPRNSPFVAEVLA